MGCSKSLEKLSRLGTGISASFWVESVKGLHYRSLWFKNIIKSKRNQVRESMKEHRNKKVERIQLFKNILAVVLNRCTWREIQKIAESIRTNSRIKKVTRNQNALQKPEVKRPEFTLLHMRAGKKLPKRLYLLKVLKTQHENFLTQTRIRGPARKWSQEMSGVKLKKRHVWSASCAGISAGAAGECPVHTNTDT